MSNGQPSTRANYALWLGADTSSQLSSSIHAFALPVIAMTVSGSPAMAGTLSAIAAVCTGVTAMVGGVVVDRHDKRRLLILSAVTGIVIFGAAALWGTFAGVTVYLLYAVAVAAGLRSGILGTVSNVLLREIVSEEKLPKAMSINQGRDAAIELSGSPIAGVLVQLARIAPFITGAALNLVGLICALLIRKPDGEASGDASTNAEANGEINSDGTSQIGSALRSVIVEAGDGIRLIWKDRLLRKIAVISALFFPLLNGLLLFFVLAAIEDGASPAWAGLINSSVAVGVLVGAAIATWLVDKVPSGRLAALTFSLPGPFAITALLVDNLWLRLAALAPMIIFLPAGNAAFGGFIMRLVPSRYLGRYFSLLTVLGVVIGPIVSLFVGFGLEHLGTFWPGCILIAAMVLIGGFGLTRDIRSIPLPKDWGKYISALPGKSEPEPDAES